MTKETLINCFSCKRDLRKQEFDYSYSGGGICRKKTCRKCLVTKGGAWTQRERKFDKAISEVTARRNRIEHYKNHFGDRIYEIVDCYTNEDLDKLVRGGYRQWEFKRF